ncbi:MAG: hypothetical protein ACI8T1_000318, partial [Verrucomicrobiales bacterium]
MAYANTVSSFAVFGLVLCSMEASGQDLTFEKHVRPILKAAC